MLVVKLSEYIESLERILSQYTKQELKCTYDDFQKVEQDGFYKYRFQINFCLAQDLQEGTMTFPSYSFPVVVNAEEELTCEEVKQVNLPVKKIYYLFQDCWWTSTIFYLLISYLLEYEEILGCTTMTPELYQQYEQAVIRAADASQLTECTCNPILKGSKILN